MPKITSNKCNKKLPVGAHLVKKSFPENSTRKGYFVDGGAPVVKYTRGSAKGCVRSARAYENKRIRQANRGEIRRTSASPKKASPKKASPKKASPKKASTPKKASPKKAATPKKASPKNKKATPKKASANKTNTPVKRNFPLNQDFVQANINRKVLCYAYQPTQHGWEKRKGDKGRYYIILGFTDDDENDESLPWDYEYGISSTPKQFIMVKEVQGLHDSIQLTINGELRFGFRLRLYVDGKSAKAKTPVKAKTPKYVPLNRDFVRANINRTVFCNFFEKNETENWVKNDDDEGGKYYKIIGFTDDEYYSEDFQPQFPLVYENISQTAKRYIVLHEQGMNNPLVIKSDGVTKDGSNRVYVDTSNARPVKLAKAPVKAKAKTPVKTKANYVLLNQDFALANINRTVRCFGFEDGKKIKGDQGKYYKIIGFTNNPDYDVDYRPEVGYQNISETPQQYIVLHEQGMDKQSHPIVIENNGNAKRGGYYFYVDTADKRPEYVLLDDEFVRKHISKIVRNNTNEPLFGYYAQRTQQNEWKLTDNGPGQVFIMGFTDNENPGETIQDVQKDTISLTPKDFIALEVLGTNRILIIRKTGETLNGQYRLYVSNPDF